MTSAQTLQPPGAYEIAWLRPAFKCFLTSQAEASELFKERPKKFWSSCKPRR